LSALATRLGGGSRVESALAACAATIATFTIPLVAFFWGGGAISFVLASALAVPVGLGLATAIATGRILRLGSIAWLAAAMLTLTIHPAVLPVLFAELVPAIVLNRRAARLAWMAVLAFAFAVPIWPALAAVGFAARQSRDVASWLPFTFLQGGKSRLWQDWAVHLLHTEPGWTGGAGGLVGLAALTVLSLVRESQPDNDRRRDSAHSIVCAGAVCLVLAYGVSRFKWFRFVQPYRFLVPLAFVSCVLAGRGAAALGQQLARRSLSAWLVAAALALVLAESSRSSRGMVLGAGEDDAENAVVAFLERGSRADDRVLVESRWTNVPAYPAARDRINVTRFALLPLRSGHECLGYGGTSYIGAERYAGFGYGSLLGRRLASLTPADLRSLLDRYAISWLVACEPTTKQWLTSFPGLVEHEEAAGDCEIFRVRDADASRLLEGSGRVRASLDRIEVTDAAGERVVLKYHWAPILRAEPPVRLEEAPQPAAPVGFIAAYPQGRRAFTIRAEGSLR
jgi:hypothetical protein